MDVAAQANRPILSEGLRKFPDEAELIGQLVLGYGELEIALWRVLRTSMGDDGEATRLLFQRLGEETRITVAVAAMRRKFLDAGIAADLDAAIKELGRCKAIRNRYAHAYWDGDEKDLHYADLEAAAKSSGVVDVKTVKLPLTTLVQQTEKFSKCRDALDRLDVMLQAALSPIPPPEAQ